MTTASLVKSRLSSGLLLLVSAALLTGLWIVLRPSTTTDSKALRSQAEFELELNDVAGYAPGGSAKLMPVAQGERVRIVVHGVAAGEIHLHGYELHQPLDASGKTVLSFVANRSGRYALEWHDANVQLAALEVYPAR